MILTGGYEVSKPYRKVDTIPTYEQLYEVYIHARAMCFGEDWNSGTHAKAHRKKLVKAVSKIAEVRQENRSAPPVCSECGSIAHYCGPDPLGGAFYCVKCKIGWAQST